MRSEPDTPCPDAYAVPPVGASGPGIGKKAAARPETHIPPPARHDGQAPDGGLTPASDSGAFEQWVRPALARCLLASVSGHDLALPWEQVLEELGLPVGNAA